MAAPAPPHTARYQGWGRCQRIDIKAVAQNEQQQTYPTLGFLASLVRSGLHSSSLANVRPATAPTYARYSPVHPLILCLSFRFHQERRNNTLADFSYFKRAQVRSIQRLEGAAIMMVLEKSSIAEQMMDSLICQATSEYLYNTKNT